MNKQRYTNAVMGSYLEITNHYSSGAGANLCCRDARPKGLLVKKSYTELVHEIERLKKEAEKARAVEVDGVIARIREAIEFYHLTPEDLGFVGARPRRSSRDLGSPPKYRDGSGNVWSGRGPRPRWLKDALSKGAKLEQFSVEARSGN